MALYLDDGASAEQSEALGALPFLGLWVVMMMAAMMLPSVAPVAMLCTRLITGASAGPGRLLRMTRAGKPGRQG